MLTMEFLDGVKVTDVGTAAAPDLDRRLVARRGADAVLAQMLVHGLFHADPHPGNILVLPGNVVAFVDFGTVNQNVALDNFRVAPGLGLRITVPAMGPAPIALDFAFPVAKADTDDTQVFSFSVGLQR